MTDHLFPQQHVNTTENQRPAGFTDRERRPMSNSASKRMNSQCRRIVRAGYKPVYDRIYAALWKLRKPNGVARVGVSTLIFIVVAAYPDEPRPLTGELYDSIIYGQYLGLFRRLSRPSDGEGVITVRFLTDKKNDE